MGRKIFFKKARNEETRRVLEFLKGAEAVWQVSVAPTGLNKAQSHCGTKTLRG